MSFHPRMPYGEGWHKSDRQLPEEGPPFAYTDENRRRFEEIASHYPPEQRKSAIIAALYIGQEEQGYVSRNVIRHVAEVIGCTTADVEDVVTYYVMFFTRPVGTYVLQVCRTLSCALNGAEQVTDALCRHLHIQPGGTDATGTFTVQEFECLGACDRAPVVMINNEHWQEHQRPEDVPRFLEDLRTRGLAALTGCHLVPAGEHEPHR
jgi:NADH-quinone oxidoreductase E subunit